MIWEHSPTLRDLALYELPIHFNNQHLNILLRNLILHNISVNSFTLRRALSLNEESIELLARLTTLQSLHLKGVSFIGTTHPLSNLVNLTTLTLASISVLNEYPLPFATKSWNAFLFLTNLTNLVTLSLQSTARDNLIERLSQHLTQLKSLDLSQSNAKANEFRDKITSNIRFFLTKFYNLEHLNVYACFKLNGQ
jgi:hypothetical protein